MHHTPFKMFIAFLLLIAFSGEAMVGQSALSAQFSENISTSNAELTGGEIAKTNHQVTYFPVAVHETEQHDNCYDECCDDYENECCDGNCDPSCNIDCGNGACICLASMCSAPLYLTTFINITEPVFLSNAVYSEQFSHTYFIPNSLYRPPISAS